VKGKRISYLLHLRHWIWVTLRVDDENTFNKECGWVGGPSCTMSHSRHYDESPSRDFLFELLCLLRFLNRPHLWGREGGHKRSHWKDFSFQTSYQCHLRFFICASTPRLRDCCLLCQKNSSFDAMMPSKFYLIISARSKVI